MLNALYNRYKYFFNMLAVLIFVIIIRILDWLAWTPSSPAKYKLSFSNTCFNSFHFVIIIIMIYSYRWAIKRNNKYMLYAIIVLYTLFGPILFLCLVTWLEMLFRMKGVLPLSFNLLAKYSPGSSLIILFLSSAFYLTHLIQQQANKEKQHTGQRH